MIPVELGLYLLPLAAAILLSVPVVAAPFSRRARLAISQVALPVFGTYVEGTSRKPSQEARLRAAHIGTTHRVYAARTLMVAAVSGLVGSLVGVYLLAGLLSLLEVGAEAIRAALPGPLEFLAGVTQLSQLPALQLFLLLLTSGATIGAALALTAYWARWHYLDQKAEARAQQIESSMPRTVAFIYALSRSGMDFPTVLETLVHNERVYGEAARDIGVAVRDMNTFGTDMLTALQRMADQTPSDSLQDFGENLASVLGSGRSLSEFLQEQHQRYRERVESQQQQYLDLLSTLAEVYVTAFVAGPLFLITVLVVVGLVLQDTLPITRVIVYAGLPLASLGFMFYADSLTESLEVGGGGEGVDRDVGDVFSAAVEMARQDGEGPNDPPDWKAFDPSAAAADSPAASADGGATPDGGPARSRPTGPWRANVERLVAYDRTRKFREWVTNPFDTLLAHPAASFVVTVPVAAALLWARISERQPLPAAPLDLVSAVDEPIIEAVIVLTVGFAGVYEIQKRQGRAIDDAMPDFLDRLASVNEAGATVVESLQRVRGSDLGALSVEIRRTWRDVVWGADATTALRRFEQRAGTVSVTRAVTLIVNAMRASGDLAPVLRIAAQEALDTRQLRKERLQEMLTYLLVVYIAFFVFLGIVVAISVAFLPAVKAAGTAGAGGGGAVPGGLSSGVLSGVRNVKTKPWEVLFFHIAAIQALFSGLIGGQLGEGDVADGVKHAAVMLLIAYGVFALI